jgi:quercetin dioxygenase-like cupin family protein
MVAAWTPSARAAPATLDPKALVFVAPDKIPWSQKSSDGPRTYVLWGDPDKPGPYAMLVEWTPGHFSHPHTHPHDRHIVVISGTWWVGTGKTYAPQTTTPLPAGTVVTHLAGQFHYDGAKDEPAILEISGEGPQ